MDEFDVIVVGASVAGATTATLLAREGWRVALLDRATFPREKVCGEGLMPAGAKILERLELLSQPPAACPFQAVNFHLPEGSHLNLSFREIDAAARGWITPRAGLDAWLVDKARNQKGVELREGFCLDSTHIDTERVRVRGRNGEQFLARVLVGADGIRSQFHNRFGLLAQPDFRRRFALRALVDGYRGPLDRVEVFCRPEGEAYVAPHGEGRARITLLLNGPHKPPGRTRRVFSRILGRFREPGPSLEKEASVSSVESTAPLSLRLSRYHGHRLLLVGDAAGAVDPVTGQGMSLALRDAILASRLLDDRLYRDRLGREDLGDYTRQRQLYFEPAFQLALLLLFAARHPAVARRARSTLRRNPELRRRLLAPAVNPEQTAPLSWPDRLRLFTGL